jgi:peptidoglycan/LPS O-acetylase OafA/YrhL
MGDLKTGHNRFGLLRLLAATAVVFSHVWTVTGGPAAPEPLEHATGFTLGWHAVDMFFALSGLLIMASLAKGPTLVEFALARILRIVPALYALVIAIPVIAFIALGAPDWPLVEVAKYLARNFLLLGGNANLPEVFADNPIADVINIPLWTLKYEVFAYISLAILFVAMMRFAGHRLFKWAVFAVLVLSFILLSAFDAPRTYGAPEHIIRFTFAFFLGAAAWHIKDRFTRLGTWLAVISAANLVLLGLGLQNVAMQIIWVAALGLWVSWRKPNALSRFTDRQDYSYGIYIAGYPVQQAVMAVSGIHDPWFNFAFSIPIILLIAAASWNLIEKPALKLKKSRILTGWLDVLPAGPWREV